MATIIDSARSTKTILQDMRKVDMLDVSLLNPNKSPFIVLMTRLNKRVAINPEYKHIERDLYPSWDTVNNGAPTGTGVTFDVSNGDYFNSGDVIEIADGTDVEIMLVTGVATDTLTVVRDINGDGAVSFADGTDIQIIGSASVEGADKRAAKSTKGVTVTNYTQIFRDTFGVTETEKNSEMHGGSDLAQQRKEAGIAHAVKMERASLFGHKRETTLGGDRIRVTGGLIEAIEGGSSRVVNAGGALTETEWENFLRLSIENDPDATRAIFVSRLVAQVISGWARGKLKMVPKDKTYGINVTKYISPMGDFNLIQHPLLYGSIYGGYALSVVLKDCLYRPLQNRDTKLKTPIQGRGEDKILEEYITEAGFQWKHANKHTELKGVTL